jgi:hypothetical protein
MAYDPDHGGIQVGRCSGSFAAHTGKRPRDYRAAFKRA